MTGIVASPTDDVVIGEDQGVFTVDLSDGSIEELDYAVLGSGLIRPLAWTTEHGLLLARSVNSDSVEILQLDTLGARRLASIAGCNVFDMSVSVTGETVLCNVTWTFTDDVWVGQLVERN